MSEIFNSNQTDHVVATIKGVVGAAPFAGAILTEIVGSIIPNQRIDRIAEYLEKLQSVFDDQFFEQVKNSPDKVAIIEEGMFAAGLTPHKYRIERIAYVIANGLNEDDVKADNVSKLLYAVKNISNYDVVILQSYKLWGKEFNGYNKALSFQKKHPQIWPTVDGSPFDETPDTTKYERSRRIYEEANEKVLSSARYLASLSLLKPYNPREHYDSSEGVERMVERLSSVISEEEYCITNFGLEALNAIEIPNHN